MQQGNQRFRAPDVTLLCALGSTSQQDNKLATPLGEVHAPSGPDVDSELGHTVAHRFNVAEKTSFKSLDPGNHNTTNRGVCQMVKPRGELRECLDDEHGVTVIGR